MLFDNVSFQPVSNSFGMKTIIEWAFVRFDVEAAGEVVVKIGFAAVGFGGFDGGR